MLYLTKTGVQCEKLTVGDLKKCQSQRGVPTPLNLKVNIAKCNYIERYFKLQLKCSFINVSPPHYNVLQQLKSIIFYTLFEPIKKLHLHLCTNSYRNSEEKLWKREEARQCLSDMRV